MLLFHPKIHNLQFSSVHSVMSKSLHPCARLPCISPTPGTCSDSSPLSWDAIQPSHPLSSPLLLPSVFPSIRVFSSESVLHIRCPRYWHFNFSISPSHEYLGLISFRIDWLDLLAVQGTLKNLLQHHSSKVLSFLYSPTLTSKLDYWKNHSLEKMDLYWQSNAPAFKYAL